MEETPGTKSFAPEIALIGILLLLSGINDVGSVSLKIRQMLSNYSFLHYMAIYAWQMPGLLLAVASIMCGAGLLRNRWWARNAAIAVLIGLIGHTVYDGIVNRLPDAITAMDTMFLGPLITHRDVFGLVFKLILKPAMHYMILLLFIILSSLSGNTVEKRIGFRSGVNAILRRIMPAAVPGVVILIALLIINQNIPSLFFIKDSFNKYELHFAIVNHRLTAITHVLDGIVTIGSIVAGVGLLRFAKWSLPAAVGMLLLSCGAPILAHPLFHTIWPIYIDSDTLIPWIGRSIVTLSAITGYVVMMVYLIRHWPRTAEPEMAAEVS